MAGCKVGGFSFSMWPTGGAAAANLEANILISHAWEQGYDWIFCSNLRVAGQSSASSRL